LARRAAELQMPAVALADRDGLYGTARFVDACEREGVRPILGASLTVREPGTLPLPRSGRRSADASVVLLARNTAGYANLCRLVTDAHMTGERGDPSLTPAQICAHAEGLVALLRPRSRSRGGSTPVVARRCHTGRRSANARSSPCSTGSSRTPIGRSAHSSGC